jgi:hypothetical protein
VILHRNINKKKMMVHDRSYIKYEKRKKRRG